jgi:hypothetical protein
LVEVANFDTYLPDNNGFNGAWGAYPFLPSGLILISDIESGLFVLEPTYIRACWLEGNITRSDDNTPLFGAQIEIVTTNVVDLSDLFGNYSTGFATAGTYEVIISKPGFASDTATVVLQNDSTSIVNAELNPLPSFTISGIVTDVETGEPISNAKVIINNDFFSFDHETAPDGSFVINEFFEGNYEIHIGKWGFVTMSEESENIDENNNLFNVELQAGYEDNFSLDLGWTETNTASQGDWERGMPIGIQPSGVPFYLSPNEDVPEDDGNSCYVTGNTSDINNGVLIGGNARLTSPVFDLTAYENPSISFYTWYFNLNINTNNPGNDKFWVRISNGIETKTIATFFYEELAEISWLFTEIAVTEFIEPTAEMTVFFEAQTPGNFSTVSEAGVDNFKAFEGEVTGIKEDIIADAKLIASPNPSEDVFFIDYKFNNSSENATLRIYNLAGQMIEELAINNSEGRIKIGEQLQQGLYIIQLLSDNIPLKSIRLIKN